jgi:adenylate kinase
MYAKIMGSKWLSRIFVMVVVLVGPGSVLEEGRLYAKRESLEEMRKTIIGKDQDEVIADALFAETWESLCAKFGEKNLNFPRQIVFLNGAPGAGKGTNTLAVMRELEIPTKPVEVSSLLDTPQCEELKAKGMLVPDEVVIAQVMDVLLKPENARGIIIDGFPRTPVQAYFLSNLIDKVRDNNGHPGTVFKMINFAVSRQTSINRQLSRGNTAIEENKKRKGRGQEETAVRPTDMSVEAATFRYQTYENSINKCTAILRDDLELYEINAEGSFKEVSRKVHSTLLR